MKHDALPDSLATPQALAAHLAIACEGAKIPGAAVAIIDGQSPRTATFGLTSKGAAFDMDTAVPLACAVRVVVATLLMALISSKKLRVDGAITDHLDLASAATRTYFRGITLRHLLSQSDGIGYRPLEIVPKTDSGFVDLETLTNAICEDERAFPPGRFFSTSRCGFGLLAAVIERHLQVPFGVAAHRELLAPLAADCSAVHEAPTSVCAASGRGLLLSTRLLTRFVEFVLDPSVSRPPLFRDVVDFAPLFEPQVRCLGWSGGSTGACLGWRSYAGGWIGHNGSSEAHTVMIRIHPARKIALIFQCGAPLQSAYAALGRLFGSVLAEFDPAEAPRLLSPQELAVLQRHKYVKQFGNQARRFEVREEADQKLKVAVHLIASASAPLRSSTLLPATREMFVVAPPLDRGVWFLQFLRSDERADPDMLWDGWHLWPELSARNADTHFTKIERGITDRRTEKNQNGRHMS